MWNVLGAGAEMLAGGGSESGVCEDKPALPRARHSCFQPAPKQMHHRIQPSLRSARVMAPLPERVFKKGENAACSSSEV